MFLNGEKNPQLTCSKQLTDFQRRGRRGFHGTAPDRAFNQSFQESSGSTVGMVEKLQYNQQVERQDFMGRVSKTCS